MFKAMSVPIVGHRRIQPEVRAEDSSGADADQPRHDVRHDEAEFGRHHPAGGHFLYIEYYVITSHKVMLGKQYESGVMTKKFACSVCRSRWAHL